MATAIPSSLLEAGKPYFDGETFSLPPNLVMGDTPAFKSEVEVSGAAIAAYSVVGKITASGKIIVSNPAAVDGSQSPIGFTVAEVTATDQKVAVVKAGTYNPNALTWHAGFNTAELKRNAFRAAAPMIFVQAPGTADA